MNDLRKMIYGTLIGFFLLLGVWFSIIYVSACGFTFTCHQASPLVERTPIPTLIPALHSESQTETGTTEFNKCKVAASDLIGAWVAAGSPETDVFAFTDMNGKDCEGTYAEDVQPLFVENSIWRTGEIGCVSCHNVGSDDRNGGLDIATYQTISASGILGNGKWEDSRLFEVLSKGLVPDGHSADVPASNPVIYAGAVVPQVDVTPTP